MAGKTFIADIVSRLGREERSFGIRGQFLVHDKQVPLNKNGNPFLALVLKDRDGTINAKMWDNVEDTERRERFGAGDFIRIEAEAQSYRGQPQLKIKKLSRMDPPAADALADFLGASVENPARMVKRVRELLSTIGHSGLRDLLVGKLDEPSFRELFMQSPAAKTNHHAHLSGLLEHTLSIMELADRISGHYQLLDRDLLLAGAFLHDLGKTRELTTAAAFAYSDEGNLIGHLVIGAQMFMDWSRERTDLDEELVLRLAHMILSHHGKKEFGSPVVPKFTEAMVLHFLDNLDSKVQSMFEVAQREAGQRWSSYQRQFESYLFLGDKPGPVEMEAPEKERPPAVEEPTKRNRDLTHKPLATLGQKLAGDEPDTEASSAVAADADSDEG